MCVIIKCGACSLAQKPRRNRHSCQHCVCFPKSRPGNRTHTKFNRWSSVCVRTRTSTAMMRNRGKYLCCKFTCRLPRCRPTRSICAAPGFKFRARVVCTTCAKTHTHSITKSATVVYPTNSGYKRTFHVSIKQQALRGAVLNLNQNIGFMDSAFSGDRGNLEAISGPFSYARAKYYCI